MDQHNIIELARWFDSPRGRYLQKWQQEQINKMVINVFGYHAIQIGMPEIDFMSASLVRHKVYTECQFSAALNSKVNLVATAESLPIESSSVDLLVLAHTLETSVDPHQILREAQRVLIPEGTLILTGFNPYSLWGLRERFPGIEPILPIPAHLQVSVPRLKDWFKLLSFEYSNIQFGCYAPPCKTEKWLNRWSFLEDVGHRWWSFGGALYAIKAVKKVAGMRLIGAQWKKSRLRPKNVSVVSGKVTSYINNRSDKLNSDETNS